MAIVLRSSLESWVFQAGRFVWEQARGERQAPSIPQLRAALMEHASAAARAETRAELAEELRGVFEAALALAANRGIPRTELEARPRRARARKVLERVAALRSTASDMMQAPPRARSVLDRVSDFGSSLESRLGRHAAPEPLPPRARARRVLDRVAELRSSVRDPMAVLDRVAELGSSVASAADAGAVLERVADLRASVADAADRGASAVIRGATAAMGGSSGSGGSGSVIRGATAAMGGSSGGAAARSHADATAGPAESTRSHETSNASSQGERLPTITIAGTKETSVSRVSASIDAWRVDAVMSRWLGPSRREPAQLAAIGGGRGAARWVASRLSSLDRRGYDSHARFALRARWPGVRARRWFGRRQRQFKVVVEQRSKGMALATIPASAGAQLAAWAVTTTSRFLLERWLLPYLMRKAAPLRVAPVAGKLLWGFGRVAVPTGLRLLARTSTRAR